jgi:hypothetical protein
MKLVCDLVRGRRRTYSVTYDWRGEPAWTHRPAASYFLEELEMFPRSDDNISDWLRQRAGLPIRPPALDGDGPAGEPPIGKPRSEAPDKT